MSYEVGTKVVINSDIFAGDDYDGDVFINEDMVRYAGMLGVIRKANNRGYGDYDTYYLAIQGRDLDWVWTDRMFKVVESVDESEMPVDLPTLMDKTVTYDLSDEERSSLVTQATELLREYNYTVTDEGLNAIFDEWVEKKGWMIEFLKKSPFYNGKYKVVFPANMKRGIDMNKIEEFMMWASTEYKKIVCQKEVKIGLFSYEEYYQMKDRIWNIYRNLPDGAYLNGLPKNWYYEEWIRMSNVIKSKGNVEDVVLNCTTHYVPSSEYNKLVDFRRLLGFLRETKNQEPQNIISETLAEDFNACCESMGLKTRAIAGQKIMKFVGKVLKELGLNHVVDMQRVTWHDENGNFHERVKDMGYNFHFAELGDAINPYEYTREIVISVDPIDYWTMSFGYKWASCHTIDKENSRNEDENHNYSGMYSAGTTSYMLDDSTVMVYVRPTEEELKKKGETELPIEEQSKFQRCVFYLGEDKMGQSRVYPDGRDGGDEGIAAQLREIMQKFMSEVYETSNMWTLKKGTRACTDVIQAGRGAMNYKDYANYDDCNVSYLRRVNGNLNLNKIIVGAMPICPGCGETHNDDASWITCRRCRNEGIRCDYCEGMFDEDDDDAITTADGRHFCCQSCASDANYVYAVDEEEWRPQDDCTWDDYEEEYYYYDQDGEYIDGSWYHDADTARRAGYEWSDYDECWCDDDELERVGDSGEYFSIVINDDFVEIDRDGEDTIFFPNRELAEEDGYVFDEETETWIAA